VGVDEEADVDKVVDQSQRVDVLDALPRNLIACTSCRFSIADIGSETPLSLEPLHDGQRDRRTENGGAEIREYEVGLFSCVLSSIQDVSFYT
jgi:hypothetical protein